MFIGAELRNRHQTSGPLRRHRVRPSFRGGRSRCALAPRRRHAPGIRRAAAIPKGQRRNVPLLAVRFSSTLPWTWVGRQPSGEVVVNHPDVGPVDARRRVDVDHSASGHRIRDNLADGGLQLYVIARARCPIGSCPAELERNRLEEGEVVRLVPRGLDERARIRLLPWLANGLRGRGRVGGVRVSEEPLNDVRLPLAAV